VYDLVTDADALAGKIHNRMPVVLDDADVGQWRSASAAATVDLPAALMIET
jgi:putative SOS response-associated peptidase YedK